CAKYGAKSPGQPAGPTHGKSPISHPRVPDAGRDRALDGGRQEVQPLRPSGRNHDPDRLSPRLAGVRVVRSAMVAGRVGHRPATRPQGEERLAECPPNAGRRDTRAAASAARTGAILAPWLTTFAPRGRRRTANVPRDFAADRGATAAATTSACIKRSMSCIQSCIQEQPTEGVRPDARENGQIRPSTKRSGYPRYW